MPRQNFFSKISTVISDYKDRWDFPKLSLKRDGPKLTSEGFDHIFPKLFL
jgi:hypothetical protein